MGIEINCEYEHNKPTYPYVGRYNGIYRIKALVLFVAPSTGITISLENNSDNMFCGSLGELCDKFNESYFDPINIDVSFNTW